MNLILKCLSSRIYSFFPRLNHKYIPTLLFLFLFIFVASSHIRKHGLSALHLAVFPELPFPCGPSLCSLGVPQCPAYCWPEIPERRASQQDHPHASFNLAVGKLKNITGSMAVGDIEMLLHVAARQGIQEAQELLENIIWTKSKPLATKRVGSF
uniref:Uncharacterized protein n=1 Tax=Ovis aries TaxID=9940 RepID=A0AC11D5Y9_SHEEP